MMSYYEFIQEKGWRYENVRDAYDRYEKSVCGKFMTESEFIAEANVRYANETINDVYQALLELVKQKKLHSMGMYRYVRYQWCLRNPEAIVAYQTEFDRWEVNNCDMEVTEEAAKIAVNREWGFEVSRIRIIGIPYYGSTHYQFICCDCEDMNWLSKNGNLYRVYE